MEEHCGKYPVVCLNLKDCVGETWEEALRKIRGAIGEMIKPHLRFLDQSLEDWKKMEIDIMSKNYAYLTLRWLIQSLYEKHGQKVLVLIDEYDAPLHHAFRNGYLEQASKFFSEFYGLGLKDNNALEQACLMGIVEIRREGLLSALNNITIYNVENDTEFDKFFGFTVDEIKHCVTPEELPSVLEWYNGYTIGSQTQVINPWAFSSWIITKKFSNFWVSTGKINALKDILGDKFYVIMKEIYGLLFSEDKRCEMEKIVSQVYIREKQNWSKDSILHYLVFIGYLTFFTEEKDGAVHYFARIPNREVREDWGKYIDDWLSEVIGERSTQFEDALIEFDVTKFSEIIKEMILKTSYYDLDPRNENSYHLYILGLMVASFWKRKGADVTSNFPSGHGIYDVCLDLAAKGKAVLIEFKIAGSGKLSILKKKAAEAIEQIKHKKYASSLKDRKVLFVGIAFHKKNVFVLSEEQKDLESNKPKRRKR